MSRYIEAEWIRNVYADFNDYNGRDDWTTPIANVLAVIDDTPSIDIVRCKECKYKDMEICPMYKLVVAGVRKYDDFCSYGEREGE